MPNINILNESDLTKSTDQNAANVINLYLVEGQDQDKYQVVAYPTPGATLFSAGSSVMRAEWSQHGITYGIDGNQFFSVNSSGTRTNIGTLNSSSGWAKIRGNLNQLFIADSSNGYCYDITTNTFSVILNASSKGIVQSITISTSGTGYSNSATVTISGGGGSGATGTPIVDGGVVTGVQITSGGSGYTSAPTATFNDSTGTGATGTPVISTNAFPASIQDIECQDEFGLVLQQNSQVWFASGISNLQSWPQLSFASTTGNQNYNVGVVSVHREIFLLGTQTTEVWDNLGQANFTFGRNTSAFIEYGCAARSSIAKGDNAFFFLGQNPSGGTVVMRMNGYSPVKISNRGLDYQISTYTTVSDAVGLVYQQEGHEFYAITFPTAGTTWVYDLSTEQWHQRQSLVNGVQTQWLASCYTFNYNKCLVGDYNTGNIYQLDMTNNTENGSAITRTLVSHPFYAEGAWMYLDKLQVDFDNSPGASLSNWTLYISRDGGRTFGTGKAAIAQQDANGMYRVYWLRLGQAHAYVCKVVTNANMKTIILGAWANIRTMLAT